MTSADSALFYGLSSARKFQARPAASITREVAPADFSGCLEGHATILRRGALLVRKPSVVGPHAGDFRIQRPFGMPWRCEGFPEILDHPAMTISRLPNTLVLPGGVLFSENADYLLSESFSAYWEPQPHISIAMHEGDLFSLKESAQIRKRLTGTHFYCDSQHIAHFGHFFMDDLVRMWGYIFCTDFLGMSDVKVLTRTMTYEVRHALTALGVSPENIIELSEPVVCQDLILATRSLQRQDYVTPLFSSLFRRISEGFRERVTFPGRIYISRIGNNMHRLVNEEAVAQVFQSRGFAVMHPSEFGSFERQVLAFTQAEYIAGASGTNMYCSAFQKVARGTFVLVSPLLIHYADYHTNQGHPGPLTFYVGDCASNQPDFNPLNVNSPWVISDIDDLAREVDNWLAV